MRSMRRLPPCSLMRAAWAPGRRTRAASAHRQERLVRVNGRAASRMPLEVQVVRAPRVAGAADVADHSTRADAPARGAVARKGRVERVAAGAVDVRLEPARGARALRDRPRMRGPDRRAA